MTDQKLPRITWRSLTTAAIVLSVFVGILVSDTARAQVVEPTRPSALTRMLNGMVASGLLVAGGVIVSERVVVSAEPTSDVDLEF